MTCLENAHREWATRRPDERFSSLADMHTAALGFQKGARVQTVPTEKLRVIARDGDIKLAAKEREIDVTNWSFGQLSTLAGAPASYMNEIPAELAAECVNYGLKQATEDRNRDNKLLFKIDEHSGMATLRALTSEKYGRIWNADITRRLLELEAQGTWRPAPAAFDGSRGLYLSDRDMFAFMVDNERRIFDKAQDGGLSRGFFIKNSEVGAAAFSIMRFAYEFVCGNHRVWGVSQIAEINIRHIGDVDSKVWGEYEAQLKVYAESSAADDEAQIAAMRNYKLGNNVDEIIDAVMGLRIAGLGKRVIADAYQVAVDYEAQSHGGYGDPRTVWAMAGGLTQIARDMPIAGDRVELERASGKLMEIAF